MATLPKEITKAAAKRIAKALAAEEYTKLTASWDLTSNRQQRVAAQRLAKFLKGRSMAQLDPIKKVYYKSTSKVVLRYGQIGARLMDGEYAIIEDQRLFRFGDIKNALRSLDVAIGGFDSHTYENLWDTATLEEKAELIHLLKNIDWDKFWAEEYDTVTGFLSTSAIDDIEAMMQYAFPKKYLGKGFVRLPQKTKIKHKVR